ncbi:MAG: redoxin domain-containing protein [Pseudomonadota bacterium]
MALAETPICDFGRPAPDFALPSTDGATVTFAEVMGPKGALIMFICNHCPYVVKAIDRIVADAKLLKTLGIGVAAGADVLVAGSAVFKGGAPDAPAAYGANIAAIRAAAQTGAA